jgi:hypothetical protein
MFKQLLIHHNALIHKVLEYIIETCIKKLNLLKGKEKK